MCVGVDVRESWAGVRVRVRMRMSVKMSVRMSVIVKKG